MSINGQAGASVEVEGSVDCRSEMIGRIERELRHSSYSAIRNLSCEYDGGCVTLRGRVPTYFLKQIAQACVGRLEGVDRIVNGVEVFDPELVTARGAGGFKR